MGNILALNVFAGMFPRSSRQQLPPKSAELAVNCNLLSGDLRALRSTSLAHTLASPTTPRHAFRVPAMFRDDVADPPPASIPDPDDIWIGFEEEFSHFLKGPLAQDAYNRWYWTEEGKPPQYNTLERIINGDPSYRLGVPRPVNAPSVVASGGTTDLKETRCYVYIFITIYGEEGAPSEPTCAEGNGDGTWTIDGMDIAPPAPWDTDGAPIAKKRIYRTITGQAGSSFFFVEEIDVADASFVDDIPTDEVSLNAQLESDAWIPPPEDLIGLTRHPNGFLVGFSNKEDLNFSIAYRPHAWPAELILTTDGAIQALGVFGTSIAVATNAHPYVSSGSSPDSMSLIKNDTSKPCLSRFGVISSEDGVLFPSANGLALIGPGGVSSVTQQLITRSEWKTRYQPSYLRGVRFGFQYLGISMPGETAGEPQQGFVLSPLEPNAIFTEIDVARQNDYVSLQSDPYSGEVYAIVGQDVLWWADYTVYPEAYTWVSAEFVTAKPCNFGAYRIDFDRVLQYPEQSPDEDTIEELTAWNKERIKSPLDTLGLYPLGAVAPADPPIVPALPENRQALGGSPLYDLFSIGRATVTVTLWGNRLERYTKTLDEPGIYRLPEGYKTDLWQIGFSGNADLHHFKMAETGKDLERA